jgi:hypothetical protein
MEGDAHLQHASAGLERCPGCGRPFVVPVALLDLVDEGLYLIALECKNCDRLAVGVHEDAELERMERFSALAAARMESAIETLDGARSIDDLIASTDAVDRDLVVPEDF